MTDDQVLNIVAALDALGVTGWVDGGWGHVLVAVRTVEDCSAPSSLGSTVSDVGDSE
jgi:hypothetical protein